MRIEITPTKLHVNPKDDRALLIKRVVRLPHQRRLTDRPFVRSEQQDIRTRAIHLVRLSRVDRLLLNGFNLQRIEFLIEDVAHIHDDRLVDLLPQVRSEDLDQ